MIIGSPFSLYVYLLVDLYIFVKRCWILKKQRYIRPGDHHYGLLIKLNLLLLSLLLLLFIIIIIIINIIIVSHCIWLLIKWRPLLCIFEVSVKRILKF